MVRMSMQKNMLLVLVGDKPLSAMGNFGQSAPFFAVSCHPMQW